MWAYSFFNTTYDVAVELCKVFKRHREPPPEQVQARIDDMLRDRQLAAQLDGLRAHEEPAEPDPKPPAVDPEDVPCGSCWDWRWAPVSKGGCGPLLLCDAHGHGCWLGQHTKCAGLKQVPAPNTPWYCCNGCRRERVDYFLVSGYRDRAS